MSEILNDLALFSEEKKVLLLTPSSQKVYDLLREQDHNFSQLVKKLHYSDRTIRSALNQLIYLKLIEKKPDLYDLRKFKYFLKQ